MTNFAKLLTVRCWERGMIIKQQLIQGQPTWEWKIKLHYGGGICAR